MATDDWAAYQRQRDESGVEYDASNRATSFASFWRSRLNSNCAAWRTAMCGKFVTRSELEGPDENLAKKRFEEQMPMIKQSALAD
ncbi:MAG TPA: hypothetical protein VGG27_13400 [Magnetospirillaceae bacterium]|jgi:hypothetical protein